jgi:hypothetical protein
MLVDSDPIDLEQIIMDQISRILLATLAPLSGKDITSEQVNILINAAMNGMQSGLVMAIERMGLLEKREVSKSNEVIEMIDSSEMKKMKEELLSMNEKFNEEISPSEPAKLRSKEEVGGEVKGENDVSVLRQEGPPT